jgi:hypothetical protein
MIEYVCVCNADYFNCARVVQLERRWQAVPRAIVDCVQETLNSVALTNYVVLSLIRLATGGTTDTQALFCYAA